MLYQPVRVCDFGMPIVWHCRAGYGWAKIEDDGVGPRRLCRQRLKLAVAASITGFPPSVADFNYS
jgi:hypothetical protein